MCSTAVVSISKDGLTPGFDEKTSPITIVPTLVSTYQPFFQLDAYCHTEHHNCATGEADSRYCSRKSEVYITNRYNITNTVYSCTIAGTARNFVRSMIIMIIIPLLIVRIWKLFWLGSCMRRLTPYGGLWNSSNSSLYSMFWPTSRAPSTLKKSSYKSYVGVKL
jgi:hypothetical protein